MKLDFLDSLDRLDYITVDELPSKFIESVYIDLGKQFDESLWKILSTAQTERHMACFFVPKENLEDFIEYYNSKICAAVDLALHSHELFLRHFIYLWGLDAESVPNNDKGKLILAYMENQSSEQLFESTKRFMPEIIELIFEYRIEVFIQKVEGTIGKVFPTKNSNKKPDGKEIKDFSYYLNNSAILRHLVNKYRDSKPSVIIPMVFALSKLNLLNCTPYEIIRKQLCFALEASFGNVGVYASINRAFNNYLSPGSKQIKTIVQFTKEIKEMIEKS